MTTRPTDQRILLAAIEVMGAQGLARLGLEDVARVAGVSRQTVYRYFGNRDALIAAVILHEEQAFIARIQREASRHAGLRPSLQAAITAALRAAREHPLLDRLLATEPEALLPFLLSSGGPLLSAARPAFAEILGERLPDLADEEVLRAADTLTRLMISYAVDPPEDEPEHVAAHVAGLLLGGIRTT